MFFYLLQVLFVALFSLIGYYYPPFGLKNQLWGLSFGAAAALFLIVFAYRLRKAELKFIWSGSLGLILGIIIGWLSFQLFSLISLSFSAFIFFKSFFLLGFPFCGLVVGILKPNMFAPLNLKEFLRGSSALTQSYVLDTSAIIDGRIAQIINSGFLEGELIITQFVLAELQFIADSNDPLKKVRGKRGLDIIEELQKNKKITVTILNKNYPGIKEVDQKLIILAKENNYKIITNDVNLSKIAQLQEVKALNVNELAVALKPVVFPGEKLEITINKEGKERGQGIGYLNDGTMVVVDDAKNNIGETVDIEVTSLLQTTSGKIIFGKKI